MFFFSPPPPSPPPSTFYFTYLFLILVSSFAVTSTHVAPQCPGGTVANITSISATGGSYPKYNIIKYCLCVYVFLFMLLSWHVVEEPTRILPMANHGPLALFWISPQHSQSQLLLRILRHSVPFLHKWPWTMPQVLPLLFLFFSFLLVIFTFT